jgi:hypothetical protein
MICSSCLKDKPEEQFIDRRTISRKIGKHCLHCKEIRLLSTRKRIYGTTVRDYNKLLEDQGGVCAICKKPPDALDRRLDTDHCSITGAIRGLLCRSCNTGIGHLKHDPILLQRALEYVEGTSTTHESPYGSHR